MRNIQNSRRRDMLAAVLAAGGCLNVPEWLALGLRYGYNPRGLAASSAAATPR